MNVKEKNLSIKLDSAVTLWGTVKDFCEESQEFLTLYNTEDFWLSGYGFRPIYILNNIIIINVC
jgi:hypothetical protein